jgi:hypothetical protein
MALCSVIRRNGRWSRFLEPKSKHLDEAHASSRFLYHVEREKEMNTSWSIYLALILTLTVLGAINALLPQGSIASSLPNQQIPASKPVMALVTGGSMLLIYGGLGAIGLLLAQKLGFPPIWGPETTQNQRFVIPALIGVGTGVFFIVADVLVKRLHPFGALPHPPFPTSLVASAVAGIGEEVIFRLFFIPFWMWLVSTVILGGRYESEIFWAVAACSALTFAVSHMPAVMASFGIERINDVPAALMGEIILLNGVVSLLAAYVFRRYGFLAAVGVHFWTDVVWHVIWGILGCAHV